ncbi:MAG: tyrosine-type recombinase/integrase [Alkaliphilus sp.]
MNSNQLSNELFFSKTHAFLNIYLSKQVMKSKNTIRTYRDGLTIFRRYINEIANMSIKKFKFSDCSHDFLLEFIAYLKETGCASTTCNNRLASIKSYMWYVADGDISMQSIALGISKVPFMRVPKKTHDVIPEKAFRALLSAPSNNTKKGLRDQTLMVLLYDSAIRVSELLELKVSSLYLDASIPYIHVHGKGDKERMISISDKTVNHLKAYLNVFHFETESSRPLFYTVIKGHLSAMSIGNVERIIDKYAKIIRDEYPDLPLKIYPHIFRRTRATNLYQNGVELELISRILGHESTQTTRMYAMPSIEMLRDALGSNTTGIPEESANWLDDEDELARLCGLR